MIAFRNNDDVLLDVSENVNPVMVFNETFKIQYAEYFKDLAFEICDYGYADTYVIGNNIYSKLFALQGKARNILFEYKKAKSRSARHRLIEYYYTLCSQIRKLKKEIDKYENNINVTCFYKIAASFKLLTSYITRNIRSLYRTVIRFLFKNMDDNSGFDYFFHASIAEKNIYNQNNLSNGTRSIFRINMQNRYASS